MTTMVPSGQLTAGFGLDLPPHGIAGALLIALYAIQAEVRFGAKARTSSAGPADRGSTIALTLSMTVPIFGFVLSIKPPSPGPIGAISAWLRSFPAVPGMPEVAWSGVALGVLGLALRMWSLLTLRERYTRTLLVQDDHAVVRGGPYRFVRHPGYLGSLLCLNGIALASGNLPTYVASLVVTLAAYSYRIHVEEKMLVAAFGVAYESYRREVGALVPFVR